MNFPIAFSIVIPTYNQLSRLQRCIDSIFKYTSMADGELIVVSNGCEDGTRFYLNQLGRDLPGPCGRFLAITHPEPLGYSKATNMGIEASRGDFVILLNNDVVLLEQRKNVWIDELLRYTTDPTVGITGSLVLHSAETKRDFVVFFCAAIRRAVFERIGTLNEMFGRGWGEDMEFCWRAEREGYKVMLVPMARPKAFDAGQRVHVSEFPLYHEGGVTVGDYDGQRIVNENRAKLSALVKSREPLPPRR
jgi:GT2 family glycosyltransferase